MRHSSGPRLGILSVLAVLLMAACSGGFGGASHRIGPGEHAGCFRTQTESAPRRASQADLLCRRHRRDAGSAQALADAYTAKHPNVTFEIETRPGGTEGDNIVKTRLSTGEMTDIFWYNSGSLLQALNPAETLVDLSAEPFIANIASRTCRRSRRATESTASRPRPQWAAASSTTRRSSSELGLQVPKTWAEFEANNEKIKAAGIAPVGATYGDTWTSQLFVLADYYNVQAAVPDFAEQYTANKANYADTPAAHGRVPAPPGRLRQGLVPEGLRRGQVRRRPDALAEGKFAQYPMLTFTLGTIAENHPDRSTTSASSASPARTLPRTAPRSGCLPRPTSPRQPKANLDAAKDFLGFIASVEGTEALTQAIAPSGPYVIKGSTLPDDASRPSRTSRSTSTQHRAPALEFLSPVKGPSLEQITVAVGSGITTAEEGASRTIRTWRSRPSSWASPAGKHSGEASSARSTTRGSTARGRPPASHPKRGGPRRGAAPPERPTLGAYPHWFYLPARRSSSG